MTSGERQIWTLLFTQGLERNGVRDSARHASRMVFHVRAQLAGWKEYAEPRDADAIAALEEALS